MVNFLVIVRNGAVKICGDGFCFSSITARIETHGWCIEIVPDLFNGDVFFNLEIDYLYVKMDNVILNEGVHSYNAFMIKITKSE